MNVQEDKVLPCFNYKWSIKYEKAQYFKLNESVAFWRSCELAPEWRKDDVDKQECKDITCIDLEKAAWVLARLDATGGERLEMAGEQQHALNTEAEGQDNAKSARFEARLKQKSESNPTEKIKHTKKREQELKADDVDHVKKRLRSSKTTGERGQSS